MCVSDCYSCFCRKVFLKKTKFIIILILFICSPLFVFVHNLNNNKICIMKRSKTNVKQAKTQRR